MRYSHSATLVPPAQAEALYDLALDDEVTIKTEKQHDVRVDWPRPATVGRVPQRVLSGNPERRTNRFQTNH